MIRRTGLLGGTFNPVHNGHIALARAAKKFCQLDEVLLLPAAVPPHKEQCTATFSQRSDMLEVALQDVKGISCLPIENLLPKPSFTIDTIQYMQLHSVAPVDFYFIIGADAFLDISNWKKSKEILEIVHCIVFSRTGIKNKNLHRQIKSLSCKKKEKGWLNTKSGRWIYCSHHSLPSVSSSEIRQRITKGLDIDDLAPPGVCRYIYENSLYRCS